MDIINEIIHDHRRLRELLERVIDKSVPLRSRKTAFRELVPLVKAHARAEEKTIYELALGKRGHKLRALASFEEHAAALAMSEKARRTTSPDLWAARAIVFCEMLEHHLDEEEDEFFPELRKQLSAQRSAELADDYRALMPPAETKQTQDRRAAARQVTAPLEAFIP